MASMCRRVGLSVTLAFAGYVAGCNGGIKVTGGSASKNGATSGSGSIPAGMKAFSLQLTAKSDDAGAAAALELLASSTHFVTISPTILDIEIICGTGAAKKQNSYSLTNGTAVVVAAAAGTTPVPFSGTVSANCDETTVIVDDLKGTLDAGGGGHSNDAFKLIANGLTNTFVEGTSLVTASLVAPIPLGTVVATFAFNKASESAAAGNITTRSAASGTTSVVVSDGCAGIAQIQTIDAASFNVFVPQALTNPVQSTVKVHDLTGATVPYIQDGALVTDPTTNNGATKGAMWTFDFSTATTTDATVAYTLTIAGDGGQSCVANLTANVTTSGGGPIIFPPPTPPQDITGLGVTPAITQLDLAWTAHSGGATATHDFKIVWTAGTTAPPNCNGAGVTQPVASVTYSITSLTTATNYAYRICALDVTGTIMSAGVSGTATTL